MFQLLSLFPQQPVKTQLDEAPLTVGETALSHRPAGAAHVTRRLCGVRRWLAGPAGLRTFWLLVRPWLQDVSFGGEKTGPLVCLRLIASSRRHVVNNK